MGNKSSSAPSNHHVSRLTPTSSPNIRRGSDCRNHPNEAYNHEARRGSSIGITKGTSIKPKRLSPRHRNLIIKSWSRVDKPKIIKDTFHDIFKMHEDIRLKFPFGDIPLKQLRSDVRFIAHCGRFLMALDHVIGNLDQIDTVIEDAETLGRSHSEFVRGLKNEHWQKLADTLIERILGNDTKLLTVGGEVRIAWGMLGHMLVFHMRLGYEGEILRAERHGRTMALAGSSIDSDTQFELRNRSPSVSQRDFMHHVEFRHTSGSL